MILRPARLAELRAMAEGSEPVNVDVLRELLADRDERARTMGELLIDAEQRRVDEAQKMRAEIEALSKRIPEAQN